MRRERHGVLRRRRGMRARRTKRRWGQLLIFVLSFLWQVVRHTDPLHSHSSLRVYPTDSGDISELHKLLYLPWKTGSLCGKHWDVTSPVAQSKCSKRVFCDSPVFGGSLRVASCAALDLISLCRFLFSQNTMSVYLFYSCYSHRFKQTTALLKTLVPQTCVRI